MDMSWFSAALCSVLAAVTGIGEKVGIHWASSAKFAIKCLIWESAFPTAKLAVTAGNKSLQQLEGNTTGREQVGSLEKQLLMDSIDRSDAPVCS